METLWTFTVIITGAFTPLPTAVVAGFVGGQVENTSVMFFQSETSCNEARDLMIASKPSIIQGLKDADITVSECSSAEFKVE